MVKIASVIKRSGAVVPFNPERITNAIYRAAVAVGGRDRATAEGLTQQVVELLESRLLDGHIPTVEEIQDVVEKVLIENGHARVAKAYILYREERARNRQLRARIASRPSENIPWAKIWHVLDWAASHQVHTTEVYNERIKKGEIEQVIRESERAYNEDVENASEMIASRADKLKLVIITGPSSSGKTTTTKKIALRLERMGRSLVALNLDNYFFNLALHPKDEFGDYDFETPQALDIAQINEHLNRLVRGEEIQMPYYDFKTGMRTAQLTPMKLKEGDLILIDSLHGLFPPLTQGIDPEQSFKVYLEPLLQMKDADGEYFRWTDIRLIRRMLRDAAHRAYSPQKTLEHWHYVRSSEMRNIVPYFQTADYIVNSAMPYELSLYRHKLLDQFAAWCEQYKNDPLREDAFLRAKRTYQMLAQVEPLSDDKIVPNDSVIREFIGGSIYEAY
jgi:uridine kinase